MADFQEYLMDQTNSPKSFEVTLKEVQDTIAQNDREGESRMAADDNEKSLRSKRATGGVTKQRTLTAAEHLMVWNEIQTKCCKSTRGCSSHFLRKYCVVN